MLEDVRLMIKLPLIRYAWMCWQAIGVHRNCAAQHMPAEVNVGELQLARRAVGLERRLTREEVRRREGGLRLFRRSNRNNLTEDYFSVGGFSPVSG